MLMLTYDNCQKPETRYRAETNTRNFNAKCIYKIQIPVSKPIASLNFYRAMLCIRGTSHGPVSVRPSVCPSRVGVLSKQLNESSWFWHVSFLPSVLHHVKRQFGYLQNKGTFLSNFVLNSDLENFATAYRSSKPCYQLSSRKVDAQSVINWAVVGQLCR